MKILTPVLVILVVVLSSQHSAAQSIQFAREEIAVNVGGSSCWLDADYYFANHGSMAAGWSIYYPLINTDTLPFPDSIMVADASTGGALAFEKSANGVLFFLNIPPEGTRKIRVRYHQQTPAERFEYILTTTKAWGRPLERADFHIMVPDSLQLTSCSPAFDVKDKIEHATVYAISRYDFMPASNLVVQWKRRTQ